MTLSIVQGATTILPDLRIGYDDVHTSSNNVLHKIIGRSNPDVSFAADSLRSGSLSLLFLDATDAWAAHNALATLSGAWTLTDDLAAVSMTFVRDGQMSPVQQDSRARWVLEVGFQEVSS